MATVRIDTHVAQRRMIYSEMTKSQIVLLKFFTAIHPTLEIFHKNFRHPLLVSYGDGGSIADSAKLYIEIRLYMFLDLISTKFPKVENDLIKHPYRQKVMRLAPKIDRLQTSIGASVGLGFVLLLFLSIPT